MSDNTPGPELPICLGVVFVIGGLLMITGAQDGGGISMSVTGYHGAGEIGGEGILVLFLGIVGLICGGIEKLRMNNELNKYDENKLYDIARNGNASESGMAVSRISDESRLGRIARSESDTPTRKKALRKINDPHILADVLNHNLDLTDGEIKGALKKINDHNIFIEIAEKSQNGRCRVLAAEKITDENVLAKLAKEQDKVDKNKTYFFRPADKFITAKHFYKHIKDESLLADIAKDTPNQPILFDLIKKIKNEHLLADIAKNASIYTQNISKHLFKKIHDDSIIADIARNGSNVQFRMDAVERVRDDSVLVDIVKNDEYKVKKDSHRTDAPDGDGQIKITTYTYPIREKANEKLKGGYEDYCEEEKIAKVVHIK